MASNRHHARARVAAARVKSPSAADFAVELARAFAGALIFGLPMLMTMEMWSLGFHIDPLRLALLLILLFPLLLRVSRYGGGLSPTATIWDDVADTLVAIGVAAVAATVILALFGVLDAQMPLREIVGKVAVQTFAGSIGAMLARAQLGSADAQRAINATQRTYSGELFLMIIGALFLLLNVAPTEEMVLIAFQIHIWQEIALVTVTLALMHAFVYSVEFGGTERPGPDEGFWSIFVRFTVVGYAIVLLVSLYVLWTFGRTDGTALHDVISMAVVLSFPGAIGAAVARLIL
jgi:putative integral membrane protein (TIGR02587 family)